MNKRTRRSYSKKNKGKNRKTRKNIKGGLLGTMSIGINGINLSRQTGKKRYNWKTGKLDDVTCYGVGPIKWCKLPK